MARMEAAVFVGLLLGALSSGRLYTISSASVVFGCATICTLIGLACVYLFVKESIKNQTEETSRMVSTMVAGINASESIKQSKSYICRPNSRHFLSGNMLLIYFTLASNDENAMIAFLFGSSFLHWHQRCLFWVRSKKFLRLNPPYHMKCNQTFFLNSLIL